MPPTLTDRAKGYAELARRYPWPTEKTSSLEPVERKNTGFELVERALGTIEGDEIIILEIGSEFGGSAKKFASLSDKVRLICIDPWTPHPSTFAHLRKQSQRPDGFYELFLSFCWELRERLIPIRGTSPGKIKEVFDAGVVPDLIYVDGDHRYPAVYSDLEACRLFFPEVLLAGDDWNFTSQAPKYHGLEYPVRQAVIEFTEKYSLRVHAQRNSWLVTK